MSFVFCFCSIYTFAATSPTVTTAAVSAATIYGGSATLGGNITSIGSSNVTVYGIAYSTSVTTPTTANSVFIIGGTATGATAFSAVMTGLAPNTLYYIRAYATNTNGTSYGAASSFTTLAPPIINYTSQTYTAGTAITALSPTNTGGAVPANTYLANSLLETSGTALNQPFSIDFDNAGNAYEADYGTGNVLKITPAGVVSVFKSALTGANDISSIAVDPSGNVYVADQTNNIIYKITSAGVSSTFINSGLNNPYGLTFDSAGNLWIADYGDGKILEVVYGTTTPTSYATGYSGPWGLAFDKSGLLYTSERTDGDIYKVQGGTTKTQVGSTFGTLRGIAIDAPGDIFVADYDNNLLSEIPLGVTNPSNTPVTLLPGLDDPRGVTLDPTGNFVYIMNTDANQIEKVSITGYALSGTLPAGLSFNYTTGVITGTPTTAAAATTLTVTAYNSAGSSLKTFTITVNPAAPTISGAGAGCGASSVTLTASSINPAGGTYSWYGSNAAGAPVLATGNTYAPIVSGTYYVTYTTSYGTQSAKSTGSTVTINPIVSSPIGGATFSYPFTNSNADVSGNGNTAIANGSPTFGIDRYGNANSAYTFNGSSQYVTTSIIGAAPNTFTISVWFNTTTTSGGKIIGFGNALTGTSSTYDRNIYMSNTGLLYYGIYNGATSTINTTGSYNDGNWHHVIVTTSSAGSFLYVDGVLQASSTTLNAPQTNTGYWRIGFDALSGWPSAPTSNYFQGEIDDVSVYNSVLTSAQIASSNNNNLIGQAVATCVGSQLTMYAPTISGATYTWTDPTGTTATGQTAVFQIAKSGNYTLSVTGGPGGCSSSATIVPTLNALPTPTFTATSSVATNTNATITLSSTYVSADTYTWDFNGGTPSTGTGQGPFNVKWTTIGPKTITLTETNSNGCSNVYTQSVNVGNLTVTNANYAFSQNITLNTSAITGGISTSLSNFPTLVYIQEAALVASGNCANNVVFPTGSTTTNGYDFAFTMQGSTTELYYQVESYNSATGTLLVWVNVPSITSTNAGLTFYFGSLAPGHTTAFTQATWPSDYAAVYHFDENSTTAAIVDATSNGRNAVQTNTTLADAETHSAAGIATANSAYTFNGSSSKITLAAGINTPASFTLSAWVNSTATGISNDQKVLTNKTSTNTIGYKLGVYDGVPESENSNGVNRNVAPIAPAIAASTWHYLQTVYNGTTLSTYVDGAQYQIESSTTNSASTSPFYIGVGEGGSSLYFNGTISEVRVSTLSKSTDWINAEYYNQSNPTTFTSVNTTISDNATNSAAIGGSIPYTWIGSSNSSTNPSLASNWYCSGAVTTNGTTNGSFNILPPYDGSESLNIPAGTFYPVLPALGLTLPVYSITMGAGAQIYLNGNTFTIGCHIYNNGSPGGTISSGSSSSAVVTPSTTGGLTFDGSGFMSGAVQNIYGSTNSTVNLANLTESNVTSTGSLNITGGPVNVYNTFGTTSGNITIASSATVTLESSALGSASVSVVPSANNITGNVSTQRYITGGTGYRGYRFLSSPVNINGVITQTSSQANISLSYLTGGMITGGPTGTSGGFTQTTTNPLIYLFDETRAVNNTAYTQGENVGVNSISGNVVATLGPTAARVVTSNVSVPVGNAYLVYYVGNTASGDALTTTSPHNSTVTAVGYLNQGTIPVHVTNGVTSTLGMTYTPAVTTGSSTPGLQQIGNPYASTIDLDVFYTDNSSSITNIIDEMEEPNDVFVSINASTNLSSSSLAGRYIVSGQGFYLHNKASGNTLTFYEHEKVSTQLTSSTTPPLLLNQASKSSQVVAAVAPEAGYAGLHLKLMKDSVTNTETGIYFNSAWSDKYDPQEDAKDLDGTSVYLSSYSSDNQRLSLNELGDCSKGKLVNLFVSAASYGSYTLSLADIQNIDPLYHVYLRDHYLKDSVDLRQTNSYALNITSDTASYGANRFDLVIEIGALPPYKLLSFTGQKVTKGVQLNWMANNTGDYTGFVLQKEESNGTYSPIYTVQSSNISGYTYTDQNPVVGNNTYRLAQNDAYGNTTYSQPVTIGYSSVSSSGLFNVYPNPATNIINILVNSTPQTPLTYTADIYSTSGTSMEHRVLNTYTWTQDVSNYKEGVYIIVLKDTNGNVLAKSKFIKAE